jgi:hypothetical protein
VRYWSEKETLKLLALLESGMTDAEISDRMERTKDSVTYKRKQFRVPAVRASGCPVVGMSASAASIPWGPCSKPGAAHAWHLGRDRLVVYI